MWCCVLWYNVYGWYVVKIWYDRKSKDPSYFVQQGIRNGKKVTTKNIFKIGKHSELLAQGHQDPLAYAKEVVEEYNKKMKSEKVDLEITIDFNKKLIPSDNVSSKSTLLNIGYFFLQDIYSKLNLKDFIKNITKDKKIKYKLNDFVTPIGFALLMMLLSCCSSAVNAWNSIL